MVIIFNFGCTPPIMRLTIVSVRLATISYFYLLISLVMQTNYLDCDHPEEIALDLCNDNNPGGVIKAEFIHLQVANFTSAPLLWNMSYLYCLYCTLNVCRKRFFEYLPSVFRWNCIFFPPLMWMPSKIYREQERRINGDVKMSQGLVPYHKHDAWPSICGFSFVLESKTH